MKTKTTGFVALVSISIILSMTAVVGTLGVIAPVPNQATAQEPGVQEFDGILTSAAAKRARPFNHESSTTTCRFFVLFRTLKVQISSCSVLSVSDSPSTVTVRKITVMNFVPVRIFPKKFSSQLMV